MPGTGETVRVIWADRLRDARSRRVIFLAHCLLNENTRYLGGACRTCAVSEIVEGCLRDGVGMVQLPCPEARAWGGVLKRRLLWFFAAKWTTQFGIGRVLLALTLRYTNHVYRKLAREAAKQIVDYQRSGMTVLSIVGVDGSPSCGVDRTLNISEALERIGRLQTDTATSESLTTVVRDTQIEGQGLFVGCLTKELDRQQVRVDFVAHDLIGELDGQPSTVDVDALLRRHQPRVENSAS